MSSYARVCSSYVSESKTILIDMCSRLLHMSSLFYTIEILPGCPNLSFIMTTDNQSITRMIWSPSQIKNHNGLVEAMLSIVLSPDPNMQAKRKSIQQELDLENGYNILGTLKLRLLCFQYVVSIFQIQGRLNRFSLCLHIGIR